MPLEVGTLISQLDNTWPLGGDSRSQGDDHIRLIKSVLKATFPGVGGLGFSTPITAKESEINYLVGVTSLVQTQLNSKASLVSPALTGIPTAPTAAPGTNTTQLATTAFVMAAVIPSGSIVPFFQAAAPIGWTQVTTSNDAMLRVVSTAGGGTGGTDSPILMNKVPSHTHANTLTDAGHNHSYNQAASAGNQKPNSGGTAPFDTYITANTGTATTGITINNVTNTGASNWTPKYVDMIICSKN